MAPAVAAAALPTAVATIVPPIRGRLQHESAVALPLFFNSYFPACNEPVAASAATAAAAAPAASGPSPAAVAALAMPLLPSPLGTCQLLPRLHLTCSTVVRAQLLYKTSYTASKTSSEVSAFSKPLMTQQQQSEQQQQQ